MSPDSPRLARCFCAALALLLFLAQPAAAQHIAGPGAELQPAITRPAAAERVVRVFDFEPGPREVFAIPRYWDLAQDAEGRPRPGFPRFNRAQLDFTAASQGQGSVRLTTQGGSTCLRLDPGVVPVFAGTDYLVSARIRTAHLRHSRAAISARFLDHASRPISGAERRSQLITSDSDWTTLAITLPADLAGAGSAAAFLQVDLELLQPQQFAADAATPLGRHQVWPQDFPEPTPTAWFDNVAIVQLPRIRLLTPQASNIIIAPQAPVLNVLIRDLTGESMRATLLIQDARGGVVDRQEQAITLGQWDWKWLPRLDRYGWYRATLELSTAGVRVGSTYVDFAWLGGGAASAQGSGLDRESSMLADQARFEILISEAPSSHGDAILELLQRAGSRSVSLPAWNRALTLQTTPEHIQRLLQWFDQLRASGQEIGFVLPRVPPSLANDAQVETDRPAMAFLAPEQVWAPYLLPLLDKFGQRVGRWQIGLPGDEILAEDAAGIAALHSFLARLVPGPVLAVPLAAEASHQSHGGTDSLLHISHRSTDVAVGELVRESARVPRTFVLEPLPETFAAADAAIDLARKLVHFWAAVSDGQARPAGVRVAISDPWVVGEDGRVLPTAALVAWRQCIAQLAGRRVVGSFPAGSGVTCFILGPTAPGRSGALVAWLSAPSEIRELRAYLGDGPVVASDLFGNQASISASGLTDAGVILPPVHRVPLSESPVFIENIDAQLAQFLASFRADPAMLQMVQAQHEVKLHLVNPWPARVDGRITILEPGRLSTADPTQRDRSWKIHPRASSFSIGPGQAFELPLTVTFSGAEETGVKQLVAEIELTSRPPSMGRQARELPPLRLVTPLELSADSVHVELSYRYAEDGSVVVLAQVSNKGNADSTLELVASAPGVPRAKASVSELAPGAVAIRRFSFPQAQQMRGQTVTVGVQDIRTAARMTASIQLE